jgi:hypothetical protein
MGVGNDEQQGRVSCEGVGVLPITPTHARYGDLKIKKAPTHAEAWVRAATPKGTHPLCGGGVGVQSVVFRLTVGQVTCEWCQH